MFDTKPIMFERFLYILNESYPVLLFAERDAIWLGEYTCIVFKTVNSISSDNQVEYSTYQLSVLPLDRILSRDDVRSDFRNPLPTRFR